MEEFEVLYIGNFRVARMRKGYFGGEKYKCIHAENKTKYILKPTHVGQSLNEVVAQHFLDACGFNAIPTGMMMLENLATYGVTKYIDKLTSIDVNNLESLSNEQRKILLKLYLIDDILQNLDEGEFYINNKGTIYSLDYGDSIIEYDFLCRKSYENDKDNKYKDYVENIIKNNNTTNQIVNKIDDFTARFKNVVVDNKYFTNEEFEEIIKELLKSIASVDVNKFTSLLNVMELSHGTVIISFYKLWLECLINSCKELCNNNCEVVFN